MKLLTRAANRLTNRGLTQIDSIEDIDKKGVAFLPFTGANHNYLVRAKEYLYKDKAPFSPYQIERAIEWDTMLLLYVNEEDEFYVFDSRFVDENGEIVVGESKRSEDKEWVEVSIENGITLAEFGSGEYPTRVGESEVATEDSQESLTNF